MSDGPIPTSEEFVALVQRLESKDLQSVAELAGVPRTTLWNIHRGLSKNPRLETVQKLWQHLVQLARSTEPSRAAQVSTTPGMPRDVEANQGGTR
jgi:predicted transcriptional regulator